MKMYEISEKDIEKLEDVMSYFRYHNKNLTNSQNYQLEQLEDVVDRLYDIFSGYAEDPYEEISYPEILEYLRANSPYGKCLAKCGKYIAKDDNTDVWFAVDNRNGDMQTRWFKTKQEAIDWLSDY